MTDKHFIHLKGARENNLKNITIRIPKEKITVFTGVSGSGKSSIVFDTIAVESQRQLNETFTWFIRNRLPKYAKPDMDSISNLSTAIIINQKRMGGNSRSTVGTITDIQPLIRLLFSRSGVPSAGASNHYSFNDPAGMCPVCQGLGRVVTLDMEKLIDMEKSLNSGAILFPPFRTGTWHWQKYANSGFFDNDKPLKDYTQEEINILLYGKGVDKGHKVEVSFGQDIPTYQRLGYEGLADRFNRIYLNRSSEDVSERTVNLVSRYTSHTDCPSCNGKRLNIAALTSRINGYNIADLSGMEISDLLPILQQINDPLGLPVAEAICADLQRIEDVGLGYLSLNRETSTLSGGESQRLKMVKHLGSGLTNMIYIFDEPSIGLHPRDIQRINRIFTELRDKGNTVLIVEHDRDVIQIADHIIDIGPYAGAAGGEVTFQGNLKGLIASETPTGKMLNAVIPLNTQPRTPTEFFRIKNASLHNLKDISVNIPKGVLTAITGVAGSGKSTLISKVFTMQYPEAIIIDQKAIGANNRSNSATYLGIMDDIRKLFALANNEKPSLFSFNSEGGCPECNGKGTITADMAFMDPVSTICDMCGGSRYDPLVLRFKYKGKNIMEVLALTIRQAIDFFKEEKILKKLESLNNVGLGYLTLGQSLDTLSGGELQRVKLADELKKSGSIYVMDEPTTGLHMADVEKLMQLLNRLVDNGNTVIVIEHNLDVIKQADWIIDIGPEGGKKGGTIIFQGTPQEIVLESKSYTGRYLAKENDQYIFNTKHTEKEKYQA